MDYMCIHFSYMCVSIYTNVHETMQVRMDAHCVTHIHTQVYIFIYRRIYVSRHTYRCKHRRTDIPIHICASVLIHGHTHTYKCPHIHIHIYEEVQDVHICPQRPTYQDDMMTDTVGANTNGIRQFANIYIYICIHTAHMYA